MNDFERIWEDCWTRVARGETIIEECIARYPEHADELRRLFAVAVDLNQGRLVRPKSEYKARARAELLALIRSRSRVPVVPPSPERSHTRIAPVATRVGVVLALLVFLLLASGTMLAQAALPGDSLYGWKIGSEDVFRSVYPDPVMADLALTNRRVDELTQVVGTPAAERVVQQEYQRLLSDLPRLTNPSAEGKIREQLSAQKARLQRAGLYVPAIDQTLGNLSAAPAITATPTLTASEFQTTPSVTPSTVSTPSPSPSTAQTRTRRFTPTPSSTRTPPKTPEQTLTLESDGTPRPTRRAKPTETQSATPCATRSPAARFSSDPCATPTSNSCKEELATPSCETPSRTASPTASATNKTRSPTPTVTPTPSQTPSETPRAVLPDPDQTPAVD